MKTRKEMKKEINEKFESIPEAQVSPGLYVKTIGTKYVHVLNTWGKTTIEKIKIEDFYNLHVADIN